MKPRIAIAGSLAQKPCQGGHTWQFLQYLLGLRRLGWDVLFIDRLEADMCVNDAGQPCDVESSVNLRYFQQIMHAFGLEDAYHLDYGRGERSYGCSATAAWEFVRSAAFLLNVMGFLVDEDLLDAARRRVFLDTDPGFGQMWRDLQQADLFQGHDDFVTIAENIGRPDCTIPTCGLEWIVWRQPIVLDQWPRQDLESDGRFTSIGSWRGPYAPIEHRGHLYGLRVHEFRKFFDLPRRSRGQFEVALDIHTAETQDLAALVDHGWRLADPTKTAADPWVYRNYIQRSHGEFMATKGIYVDTHSGWFSERSICYLASGRPVLAQDTGLASLYPVGEGIVTFRTLDEAAEGVEAILSDYRRHATAARVLAESYFDSDKVLGDLLQKLNIESAGR